MSKYRFLHSSDWHIGSCRNLRSDYLARHEQTLMNVLEIGKKEKVDFFVISGDWFESKGTTIPEFNMLCRVLRRFAEFAPVVGTDGNHDELQAGEFQSRWLREQKLEGVHLFDKPTSLVLPLKTGTATIWAVPWCGIKDQDEYDRHILTGMPERVDVVMLHECFHGSVADSGRVMTGGIRVPDIPGVLYYALGDIHKYQRIATTEGDTSKAFFSGAPLQQRFGDQPNKGVVIVEIQDETAQHRFVPVECPIEMRIVRSIAEVDPKASVWYSLYCRADQIPLELPKNVVKLNPQPVKIEMPEATTEEKVEYNQIRIDYAEGVDQVMGELGYAPEEIHAEQESIRALIG
jgi:DNA repair exonuclease SbcCD nuclease subunit